MDILASIVCRINHLFKMAEKSKRMKWLDNRHKSRIINGTKLTPDQYKLVKAFYNNYHCKIRPYGHEFYLEKTNVFDPKFIPDSIHFRIIDRFYNDWTAAHYFDNKCFYHRIFQGIQMPDIIAYRLNGYWYNNKSEIVDFNFVQEYVNDAVGGGKSGVFVKRATDSYGGKGVWYYNPSELNINFNDIIANIESDIVIQKGIRQSATLSRLNESSVNTIRLISMLKRDGTVKIYSTILRMGIGNMKVDNATSGGITVGIQADGRLKSVAYNTNGIRLNEHPTSHVKFSDVIIPGFDKIQEAIHILHPQVPNFRLVSWDIAIDDMDRPIFIEANLCDGEIDFHQLNNGPLFGDDTESILSEVFRNK